MKNILVTGGAGFIGSNFVRYLMQRRADYRVVNYDLLTYTGNLENLEGVDLSPRYLFEKGDICDREAVEKIFRQYSIDTVVHFAARPCRPEHSRSRCICSDERSGSEHSPRNSAAMPCRTIRPCFDRRSVWFARSRRKIFRIDAVAPELPVLREQSVVGPAGPCYYIIHLARR